MSRATKIAEKTMTTNVDPDMVYKLTVGMMPRGLVVVKLAESFTEWTLKWTLNNWTWLQELEHDI